MRIALALVAAGMLSLASPARASNFNQRFAFAGEPASEVKPALNFEQRYVSLEHRAYWSKDILYDRGVFGYWRLPVPEGIRRARLARLAMRRRMASLTSARINSALANRGGILPDAFNRGGMFSPRTMLTGVLQQKLGNQLAIAGVPYAGIVACIPISFGSMVVDGVNKHERWTPLDTLGNLVLIAAPNCVFPFTALLNSKSPIEALLIAANGALPYFVPAYGAIPWQARQMVIDGVVKALPPTPPAVQSKPPRKKHVRQ